MKTVLVHEPPKTHHVRPPETQPIRKLVRFLPGTTLAVLGTLAAVGGGGVLAAFGTDGRLDSGRHLVSTPAAAVVSSVANIKNTSGVATIAGQPTVRISVSPVQGTAGAFVGIGPAADVDHYLASVTTEQVSSLSSDHYSIIGVRHGAQANAEPPAAQHFWAAQATSRRAAEINWKIRDGQYRVVIMSANGHGGFATTSAVAVTLPHIARYALVALLLGLLMAGGGTALLIRATGRSRNESNTTDRAASTAATTA
jgi:hypothetical protein